MPKTLHFQPDTCMHGVLSADLRSGIGWAAALKLVPLHRRWQTILTLWSSGDAKVLQLYLDRENSLVLRVGNVSVKIDSDDFAPFLDKPIILDFNVKLTGTKLSIDLEVDGGALKVQANKAYVSGTAIRTAKSSLGDANGLGGPIDGGEHIGAQFQIGEVVVVKKPFNSNE